MNMKYSPIERAKKRGRTACVNALLPVTTDQRRRLGFTKKAGDVVIAPLQDTPQTDSPPVKWDIVDHPETTQQTAANIIVDAQATEVVTEQVADDTPPWNTSAPASTPIVQAAIPEHINQLFDRLSARRMMYEEKGWLNTERQDNFTHGILKRMCGKDDALFRSMLRLISAQEHWGDVPAGRRRAILKDWLNLNAEGKPCAEALADFEEIKKYHAAQNATR